MISIERKTKETDILLKLSCDALQDNNGVKLKSNISTGLPFFDHMLDQLATHANWTLDIQVSADLEVDDHHAIEDIAICLGQAFKKCWKNTQPNQRYGQRLLPMDECLTLCAVDLCGRPYCVTNLPFSQAQIGGINTEMWEHFFYSFAINSGICLHIENKYFRNNHHLVESAFKAMAYALKEALLPAKTQATTKGVL
jgi:imidazoleglycerol phosphate dehydratase HisB